MNYIKRAIKFLPKKNEHNLLKIFSLSIGFAASLVMLAKVRFEISFDNFFPDKENIYQIHPKYKTGDGEWKEHGSTSGAVGAVAQFDVSGVESSTRLAQIGGSNFLTEDKNSYNASFTLVDSSFFSVFSRRIIAGNPSEIFSIPMQVMITDEIAKFIGGEDVIGSTIEIDSHPGVKLTIAGIYEKIPENSHLNLDVLVSMPSINTFMGYDGSMNWIGNERYDGYVKLFSNSSVEHVERGMISMIEKHVDMDEMRKNGRDIGYVLESLKEIHSGKSDVSIMIWMLLMLSTVILFAAVMNYVLVVISSIVARSKEITLHKCYGATNSKIHMMMLSESFVHIVLSLLLSVILIFYFRVGIEQLLGRSVDTLFQLSNCWPLIVVCVTIWLFTGLLPGTLFSHIPVTTVFRVFSDNRRRWKISLLFMQFVTAGFLVSFLWIVSAQYSFMMNDDDTGYNTENLAYLVCFDLSQSEGRVCIDEMSKLQEITEMSSSSALPIFGASGNNVSINGETMFNYADFEFVEHNFIDFMQIPLLEGTNFKVKNGTEVIVSRSFVEKMNNLGQWNEGAIGENFETSGGYGKNITVCGVFEDFRLGNALRIDSRPIVMFCNEELLYPFLYLKLEDSSSEALQKVNDKLKELFPNKDIAVKRWDEWSKWIYRDELNFRKSVSAGSLIALIITILGLIGYLNNEINRRNKEIAIRQINGATQKDIILLFIRQIGLLSISAFTVGVIGTMIVAAHWQEQFALKAPLPWYMYVGCVLILTLFVYIIVMLNCIRVARRAPVKGLQL